MLFTNSPTASHSRPDLRAHCRIIGRCQHICLLFVLGASAVPAQTTTPASAHRSPSIALRVTLAPASVLQKRLGEFQGSNLARENTLRTIFGRAGCSTADITTVEIGRRWPPDIVCTLRGQSKSEIIVGGHFDYVSAGQGVVDDWSGASMLPTLFQTLAKTNPRHTFRFIGFSKEETGRVGSRYYVSHMTAQEKAALKAMVNLECLGMNDAGVWADRADRNLLAKLFYTARALHFPLPVVNVENVGTDDAQNFRARHLPTITIHSVTQRTLHILHSPQDRMSAINMAYYYESYRLVATYLTYLDQTLN